MVYTERTEKYMSSSDKTSGSHDKRTAPPSSMTRSGNSNSNSSSGGSSGSWSRNASNEQKWKYNEMARSDRDKFNNLHFS